MEHKGTQRREKKWQFSQSYTSSLFATAMNDERLKIFIEDFPFDK